MLKILLACALATTSFASEFSEARLEDKIHHLERDLTILQKQFYKGENGSLAKSYKSDNNIDNSTQEARLQELQEQMRFFSGEVEETKHLLKQIQENITALKQEIDLRFQDIKSSDPVKKEKLNAKSVSASNKKTNAEFNKSQMQTQYNVAYGMFKNHNYTEAIDKFNEFIKTYDGDELAGSAYYWLGESYIGLNDYEKAALNFIYSYKKFPRGRKALNSLYKLSYSLTKLGKKTDACNAISKLNTTFKNIPDDIKQGLEKQNIELECKS